MEKLFGFFYQNKLNRLKKNQGYLNLDDVTHQLKQFARLVADESFEIEIGHSLWGCGFVNHELLLPIQCAWTDDRELNLDLMKILILKSVAIKKLNLQFQFHEQARNYPRWIILKYMGIINYWLDQRFPHYSDYESDIYQKYVRKLAQTSKNRGFQFQYWIQQIQCRESSVNKKIDISDLKRFEIKKDEPLDYLLATVPLPYRFFKDQSYNGSTHENNRQNKEAHSKQRNRKEVVTQSEDHKKNEINPVAHSFEKMETLDDYEGGNRIASGEDELDQHMNALDEVELNQLTDQGQAAGHFHQDIEITQFKQHTEIKDDLKETQTFIYPEWDFKKQSYLSKHCYVYQTTLPKVDQSLQIHLNIIQKYQREIKHWNQVFNHIMNRPLWKRRLIDGSELDLDALIRCYSDLKQTSGLPYIYQNKEAQELDLACSFLIDTSYSTDTWLNGQKTIHTIRDSIVVFANAIKDSLKEIAIDLTYSQTRKNISHLSIKNFDNPWSTLFERLSHFEARQYTRLGPAIRHSSANLKKRHARHSLLVVVTDGKPTDLDPYEGRYGQNDVKKAMSEAQSEGIHCLLIGVTDLKESYLSRLSQQSAMVSSPDEFCQKMVQFIFCHMN